MFQVRGEGVGMINLQMSMRFVVVGAPDLEAHLDAVADALFDIESQSELLSDSGAGSTLTTGFVQLDLTSSGSSYDEALQLGTQSIQRAIALAGGSSPIGTKAKDSGIEYRFLEQEVSAA
jgi:hypothetical protein